MNSSRILFVEDNSEYAIKVLQELGSSYRIDHARNLNEAFSLLKLKMPDLILLDIDLGNETGFDFTLQLKSKYNLEIPIIYLTTKFGSTDRITGFTLGADDYIQKSTDFIELNVRIQNVLKRHKKEQATYLEKHGIHIDLLTRKATMKQEGQILELALSPTEFKILVFFMRHDGHALSRNQLLDAIWGDKLNVNDRTIDAHIFSLRKKLDKNSGLIESVFGIGYRFSCTAIEL